MIGLFIFKILNSVTFAYNSHDHDPHEQFYLVTVMCLILFRAQSINLLQLPVLMCMAIISPIKSKHLILCIS